VQQQKIIGLTGGIGSGKSTIARMARILGFPVYDADNEVKKLYTEYPELRAAISELFGRDVFTNDQLNRSLLASRIFDTKDGKEKIGHLIQPYLEAHFVSWCAQNHHHTWLLKEAAILIESGNYKSCEHVVHVTAPESLRISRVNKRNGWSEAEILARMRAQLTEKERAAYCDFEIVNDDIEPILPQLLSILKSIMD
jgi:dephospho-CoA kinase